MSTVVAEWRALSWTELALLFVLKVCDLVARCCAQGVRAVDDMLRRRVGGNREDGRLAGDAPEMLPAMWQVAQQVRYAEGGCSVGEQHCETSGERRWRGASGSSKKFYAVRRGRVPGIYGSWAECSTHVHGFSGAIFKRFLSLQEAEDFMRQPLG